MTATEGSAHAGKMSPPANRLSWMCEAGLVIALSVVLGLLTWGFHPKSPVYDPDRLTAGGIELAQVPPDALWLDARSEEEFAQDHIPGAHPFRLEMWEEHLMNLFAVWEPDQKVVVYCGAASCLVSQEVAARLRSEIEGIQVYHLLGGWEAWKGAKR